MDAKNKALSWLESTNLDEAAKNQINDVLRDEKELEEAFLLDLEFGTGGLRGIMGMGTNRINKYTVGMATQGYANYLKKETEGEVKVAIAHDSRNNSRFFAETAANVFSANGITVYLFEELRPTPQLSFAIRHLKCHGGVVITASHNPKEYNGYKAYWADGGQMVPPHDENTIAEVQKITSIDDVKFNGDQSLIHTLSSQIDEAYLRSIVGLSLSPEVIKKQKDLNIVFSAIHGTGSTMVPRALKALGFENVLEVAEQALPDGNFPTVIYPNPEEKEAMSMALEQGVESDADLVMATDPDADRVGIAVKNSQGKFQLLNGNQTGILLVYYLLKKHHERGFRGNEYVAKTIVTTELIREIAEKFGVRCYDTLTGFKWIASLINKKEGKELFIGGGEESYGYLIGEKVRDKDAVASCAIIAELTAWAKSQGQSVFDLLVHIYQEFGFYHEELRSITKQGLQGKEEIANIMSKYRNEPPTHLGGSAVKTVIDYSTSIRQDTTESGQSIDYPKSNVLQFLTEDGTKVSIRPSGTEPKIKFYFSVKSFLYQNDYFKAEVSAKQKIEHLLNEMSL